MTDSNREIKSLQIYRLMAKKGKYQYVAAITLDDGDKVIHRLPGIYASPGIKSLDDEPFALRSKALAAVMNYVRTEMGSNPNHLKSRGYQSCSSAMRAFEEFHSQNRKCSPKTFHYHCSHFYKFFADTHLSQLNEKSADQFIQNLINRQPPYSYDTVRLAVMTASSMVEYLRNEKCWGASNPFKGLMKKYANRFPASEPEKSRIEDDEWKLIFEWLAHNDKNAARIFIEVARCTGLRPSEVYRLDTKNIDRHNLSWNIYVSKTAGRPLFRRIAIPQCLLTFLDNIGANGKLPIGESTVRRHLRELEKETGLKITPKLFRKAFANEMEAAGADESLINLHQGRSQSGVLYKHYITNPDRAVELCRPYVDRMFGDEKKALKLVQ